MIGIILAAGRGSRMQSATEDKPKCLTKLFGIPLLEYQIEALSTAGVDKIIAVGGYKYLQLQPFVDVDFVNTEWERTNMVRTLAEAESVLSTNTCIISYSDIVYRSDIVNRLMYTPGDIAITYDQCWFDLWSMRFDDVLDDAETFKHDNGFLTEIGAKTDSIANIQGQYMGLLKITPAGWAKLKPFVSDNIDMTGLLSKALANNIAINVEPTLGGWCEVDSERDIKVYESMFSSINTLL